MYSTYGGDRKTIIFYIRPFITNSSRFHHDKCTVHKFFLPNWTLFGLILKSVGNWSVRQTESSCTRSCIIVNTGVVSRQDKTGWSEHFSSEIDRSGSFWINRDTRIPG